MQFAGSHAGAAALLKSKGAPIKVVAAGALYEPKNPTSALVSGKGRSIKKPRDLVGKTILIDSPNTIAEIGVLKWLKTGGVSKDDVTIKYIPFVDMLASLSGGSVDAAFMPEPFLTMAQQQGLKVTAYPFNAVCSKDCLLTFWVARADVDANLIARFRNAVQNAAVWANQDKNDAASAKILAKYVPIDAKVIAKMNRTRFGTRLRPSLAQPWLDAFAEFGVIPPGIQGDRPRQVAAAASPSASATASSSESSRPRATASSGAGCDSDSSGRACSQRTAGARAVSASTAPRSNPARSSAPARASISAVSASS